MEDHVKYHTRDWKGNWGKEPKFLNQFILLELKIDSYGKEQHMVQLAP